MDNYFQLLPKKADWHSLMVDKSVKEVFQNGRQKEELTGYF